MASSSGASASPPPVRGRILVTGGTGFIGSHTVVALLSEGYEAHIVDNLDNSTELVIERINAIVGPQLAARLQFTKLDLMDEPALAKLMADAGKPFDACIHFAGLKAVGESVSQPIRYYSNNITGTLNLINALDANGCRTLVFSSSATVYGDPASVPCNEDFPTTATNPYGRTKLFIEHIFKDQCVADTRWRVVLLRYFNPVGGHPSGTMGEDPKGIPNNLMPYVQQVAVGRREKLTVYGNDYNTVDGTGVRDYIHVMDLAEGHVAAVNKAVAEENLGCKVYNLGTGKGTSVLEIVKAFEEASGKKVPLVISDRRHGDVAINYAATDLAAKELGWTAKRSIKEICADQWNWVSKNPYGYAGKGAAES
ncbi:hypothetical protein PPROV_000464300 [Pycnococcus provasolii]|uniref:UDP-glucose 4-epimerase n=1 Tax=Pycnococcus provasolii TaxID=41880 RepID=A0A6U0ENK4_9CHLO|nr:hypothetical protein PPROV_000464300 [Pycnococcus provasolii]|mmetsp:Transcript_63/g.126  ORF Transcript_63/g.126 Transcript_63/m.126 type:complete len:367 (+) Transcript_63:22-1122(+)